jgi:two-component system CheB/CheR fusion protein
MNPTHVQGSLAAYRTLARNLPDTTVLMFDQALRYLLAEGQALPILGFSSNRGVGYTLREALPAREAELFEPMYRDALAGKQAHITRQYGTRVYDIHILPARDDDGVAFAGMVICQDVTQQRRAEAQLRDSEQRNRALLEAMPDYMLLLDSDGRIIDQSPSALTRFSLAHLPAGVNLRDSGLPAHVIRQMFQLIEDTLRSGSLQTALIDFHAFEQDGMYEMRGVRLGGTHVMVMVRDLTELNIARNTLQKRVDELTALREIEAKLSDTLEVSAVLEIGFASVMEISGASNGFLAMYEESQPTIIRRAVGMADADTLSRLAREGKGIAARVIRTGQGEFTPDVRQDPDYHPLMPDTVAQMTLPLTAHGRRIGILVVESDRTDRFTEYTYRILHILSARIAVALDLARLYEQLKRQHDMISELERLKTEMLKLGAHDLGSPLMIISHYLQRVREEVEQAGLTSVYEYLQDITDAAERIRVIAKDILNADRAEMMVTGVLMTSVNLTDVMDEAVQTMRVNAELKGQIYHKTDWPTEEVHGQGDGPLLVAAASNLISNAIKYTPDNGTVTVSARVEDKRLIFEVTDTGFGIPENMQSKLFKPMQRVRSKETRSIEGTGFGLYLVKLIVQRHGGDVFFRSVYQQGSTFGFWLPIVTV